LGDLFKIVPKSFLRYFLPEKMRPKTEKFAQTAKTRPIWSHWKSCSPKTVAPECQLSEQGCQIFLNKTNQNWEKHTKMAT
jgi:hypothetical protein